MEDTMNESQPLCPSCGCSPCDCTLPVDWEELGREANDILNATEGVVEEFKAHRNETLLTMKPATDKLQ